MERLFGIPMGALAAGIVVLLGGALGALAVLGVRNRVLVKLAVRSVERRRGRSALIVVGLMLATTIIASALATGDTMGNTVRASVLESLGETDEIVSVQGAEVEDFFIDTGEAAGEAHIDEALLPQVLAAADGVPVIDGAVPAIIESVAVRDDTSRRNEPRVTLFGADPDRLARVADIRGSSGAVVTLGDLGGGEAYLNRDAADELAAAPGDRIAIFGAGAPSALVVRDVVDFRGAGTDAAAALVPLATAQAALGPAGFVDHVLISNRGDVTSGVGLTDEVLAALTPTLDRLGLEADPTKRDGLETADAEGNAFMSLFTTFGSFSVFAGILLIFLIFVMLAAERRGELGVARAIGTQRRHLVQLFVYEGAAYDLLAAAAGTALGVAVSFAMVTAIGNAFDSSIEIERTVEPRSLVVAFGLGILLTLVVVAVSAWRVSVLNIVTAVRNLPDPITRRAGRRRWVRGALVLVAGVAMAASGAGAAQAMPFMLGASLALLGAVLIARALGAPPRPTFTVAGAALVVWWLLPISTIEAMIGEASMDFSIFIVGGLMVVLGATWTVMYNADAILGGVVRVFGRLRGLTPVLRMAVAYPLRSRFRTATTLAMFTLVVFTLVVGSSISNSFLTASDDLDRFGGGFDIRATTAPASPIADMTAAITGAEGLDPSRFEVVGSQSFVPVEARQLDADRPPAAYALRGLDDGFLGATTYRLGAMAHGYESAEDVWEAMRTEPGLAVVDAFVAPRRSQFGFGVMPDFQLSGFYLEDGVFDPVRVEAVHPQSGATLTLTVIGVLEDRVPYELAGISTSAATLEPLGAAAVPGTHFFRLAPGADVDTTAGALESAFFTTGMEAETMAARLDEAVGASLTFQRLVLGFMGLGLVVGVAALGVVSARAVVERRQQIGVLRAVGFQKGMVRLTFLLEASFVALTAIVVGTVLGLTMGYNVVLDSRSTPAWSDLPYAIPWASLIVVFVVVYAAALLATFAPALRASRVFPAQALRYE